MLYLLIIKMFVECLVGTMNFETVSFATGGRVNSVIWHLAGTKETHFFGYSSGKDLSFGGAVFFLVSLYFSTLDASFFLSSFSLCFFLRWPCIAASPGCQAENGRGGGPLRLLPSSSDFLSDIF